MPRNPAVIATAIALPVALIFGIIFFAMASSGKESAGPVALSTLPAPEAASQQCAAVVGALPERVSDYERAALVEPAPVGAAAWQIKDDAAREPVVLRCGLDRPLEFDQAAALQVVNGVDWFAVSGAEQGITATTWFAVDRGVYIAVTLPGDAGPTPLQNLSNTLAETLDKQPIDPAPIS